MLAKKNIQLPDYLRYQIDKKLFGLYTSVIDSARNALYLDEVSHKFLKVLKQIDEFPSTSLMKLNPLKVAKTKDFNLISETYLNLTDSIYGSFLSFGSTAETLSAEAKGFAADISTIINTITNIVSEIEINGKTKKNNVSIHNESIFLEDFSSAKNAATSTLVVDSISGCLYLGSNNESNSFVLPKSVKITPTGDPFRLLDKQITNKNDEDIIQRGWFVGRLCGKRIRLCEADNNNNMFYEVSNNLIKRIINNELVDKTIEIEKVTDKPDSNLEITISITFPKAVDVDFIDLHLGHRSVGNPLIKSISVVNPNSSLTNITDNVFGKGFRMRGSLMKIDDRRIKIQDSSETPMRRILIQQRDIIGLNIILLVDEPSVVQCYYKGIYDKRHSLVRKLNLFESLVINKPEAIEDKDINQFDYTKLGFQLDKILSNFDSDKTLEDIIEEKYCYSIDFKTLNIVNTTYNTTGIFESKWIPTDKPITGVELYVDEFIPDGGSFDNIRYYIMLSEGVWTEIQPINRSIKTTIPDRLILSDSGLEGVEVEIDRSKQAFRYKVEMNGDGFVTPSVNNLVVRVKS